MNDCVHASAYGVCDPSCMCFTADTGRAKSQRPSRRSKRRQHRQRSNGRADWQRSRATGRPSLLKGKPSGHRTGQLQSRGGGRPRGRLSSNGSSSLSLYNMPTGGSALETKRKEKTTSFAVNLLRNPVLYRAAQWSVMLSATCNQQAMG